MQSKLRFNKEYVIENESHLSNFIKKKKNLCCIHIRLFCFKHFFFYIRLFIAAFSKLNMIKRNVDKKKYKTVS